MRAAGAVTALAIAAGGGVAVAQEVEGTSSVGVPSLGAISASTYGSSLWVNVSCADGGPDCSGTVAARSLNPPRGLDSMPFTIPTGAGERLRIPITGAAYKKLRQTGKLRVTVDLTSLSGASDSRTVTVTARKLKKKKKRS